MKKTILRIVAVAVLSLLATSGVGHDTAPFACCPGQAVLRFAQDNYTQAEAIIVRTVI